MRRSVTAALVVTLLLVFADSGSAQMTTISTPFQSVGDRFFESTNVGWSLTGPNFFATFNGPANAAAPPFGGYNPAAGIQSGFSFNGGPFSGGLTFGAAQGASRTFTSVTPTVTSLNGTTGIFQDSVQRPFVTGVVPIVGNGVVAYAPIVTPIVTPPQLSPLAPQLPWQANLAERGLRLKHKAKSVDDLDRGHDLAVANEGAGQGGGGRKDLIDPVPPTRAERERQKRQEEAAQELAARSYFEKATRAESEGKASVAKLYYEMAARRATGALKDEIDQKRRTLVRTR